jgi:hypothetical protein
MWVDSKGVAHTVALPDPAAVMDPDFRVALSALAEHASDHVLGVLHECEVALFEDVAASRWDPEIEALFEAVPPPAGLLTGRLASPWALRDALEGTDPRWRLDAICAVGDFLDK